MKHVKLFKLVLFYTEGLNVVARTYLDLPLPGKRNKIRGKHNSTHLSTNVQCVDCALMTSYITVTAFSSLFSYSFPDSDIFTGVPNKFK